jgi:hypothetical protein
MLLRSNETTTPIAQKPPELKTMNPKTARSNRGEEFQ